jgi:hypothetical protein
LVLVPIFPETLTASAFQEKSAQFSPKSSKDRELNKTELFLRGAAFPHLSQKQLQVNLFMILNPFCERRGRSLRLS